MDSILIVDDNRQVLEHLSEILTSLGYNVSYIPRGEFLFKRLTNSSFDLILLDVNLPGRSGIELLQDLKSDDTYQQIPVIMITGESESPILKQCFELGATDFIHKPINEIALAARVKSAIVTKRYHEQELRLEKQQSMQYHAMMLSSQMNPHFIFNALNSIQYFVMDNDTMATVEYVSAFSKLMRKTLDNSHKKFISLSEELEFLQSYLEIEKERFSNSFSYHFDISMEDIDDIFIPPMLIQPYLENAIVHGFQNLEYQGQLRVSIDKGDHMHILITDNGIGCEAASRLRRSTYRSVAMSNTKSRLALLQACYPEGRFNVSIRDLTEGATAHGTEVSITFSPDLH